MAKSDRVAFSCNGQSVAVDAAPGESLLAVLREHLHLTSVKDGCAPQGQCGCCTVLIDGAPRVACVTAAVRANGRMVTTIEGVDADVRDRLVDSFVATGASQCGFCTPGILVRASALIAAGRATDREAVDRALAAHLCRCTGWCTVQDAIAAAAVALPVHREARDLDAAGQRAALEGGVLQQVGTSIPLGDAGFADDRAPSDALVAVTCARDQAGAVEAAGLHWFVAESLLEARARAGKVQGRRTTVDDVPPLALPPRPPGGVRLATGWVEPAYLEPDASWCAPGGEPASPLANGGAFGGKVSSPVTTAARELADALGAPVRTLWSREDVARLGPKRPPIAASAVLDGETVHVRGVVAGAVEAFTETLGWPYRVHEQGEWSEVTVHGPPVDASARAVGLAERTVLLEGALAEGGASRHDLIDGERAAAVLLDTCAASTDSALAGARVHVDLDSGVLQRVDVRVAAGDPLDEVVLRSYCIGAAHMALGWVLSEGLAVDPESGEVLDLTIRSFGVLRAKSTPPIEVVIVDDPGAARARGADAVFAAVAAAAWNAVATADGARAEVFPAHGTRAARQLRQ